MIRDEQAPVAAGTPSCEGCFMIRSMRRLAHRGVQVPLLLAGLILIFFNKLAFSNLILARGDTFLYFYPYWQAAADALRAGRIPLWNPDIFMGAPFLANSQVGFFYPPNWLVWLFLPTPYAVSASILVHLAIAAGGTYWAGRRTLNLSRTAALVGAVLFALGGYLTAQVEHVNQLQGLAWLPWFFVALSPLLVPTVPFPSWKVTGPICLAIGALFALQLLAGHTQTVFISGVAVAAWLILLGAQGAPEHGAGRIRRMLHLGVILALGIGLATILAAVQLLPTIELTGLSSRQGGLPLNEVLSFSWNPLHLGRALLPPYGQPLFSEYVAFLPLTGLMLAFVGAWSGRCKQKVRPWLGLTILGLLLALGRFTPIYYFLGHLPGFDLFRAPARWLAVAMLGTALLAGYGWQRLRLFVEEDRRVGESATRSDLVRPLVVAGVCYTLLIAWSFAARWLLPVLPAGAEAPYESPAMTTLMGWAIEFVLIALLLTLVFCRPGEYAQSATVGLLLLGLSVLWLASRGLPYNQLTTPEAYFDLRPPQARLLALGDCAILNISCPEPLGRFLSMSEIFFDPGDVAEIESIYSDQLSEDAIYDYIVAVKNKEVLSPNLSMITHAPAIDGFDGGILPLRDYSRLMSLILPEGTVTTDGRLREYITVVPDARWLSLFNGRYLITDKTGDIWREGVFFDRQHPMPIGDEAVAVADVPPFEATGLWLLSEGTPPPIEVRTADGDLLSLVAQPLEGMDLYRLPFKAPALPTAISLLPCADLTADCGLSALTLVDERDGSFQPLVVAPYRLIYSGDVKIYENIAAQRRAFVVYDWQSAADIGEALAIMGQPQFNPRTSAVVIGRSEIDEPPADRPGSPGSYKLAITRYEPESIKLEVNSDTDGLLVLSDAIYPGWEAYLNGRSVALEQVDGLFRGLFLPSGEHTVELFFRPQSLKIGMIITALGLLLMVATILLLVRDRRRASSLA